jgi:hypothetical protein
VAKACDDCADDVERDGPDQAAGPGHKTGEAGVIPGSKAQPSRTTSAVLFLAIKSARYANPIIA